MPADYLLRDTFALNICKTNRKVASRFKIVENVLENTNKCVKYISLIFKIKQHNVGFNYELYL